ncbi:MAG: glycosyltransferase [Coriobacteriia bacterium]
MLQDFRPDVIHVWGTEFTNALDVMDVAGNTPVVVFIQGVMRSLVRHKYGDMRLTELIGGVGWQDKLRSLGYLVRYQQMVRQQRYEEETVRRSNGIITDSEWCDAQYTWLSSQVVSYRQSLPVAQPFLTQRWTYDKCHPNQLVCVAGATPYKGIHTVLEAVRLVRTRIPDVRLVVPGDMLERSPYVAFLKRYMQAHDIAAHVRLVGRLDSAGMATEMLQSNIMVMPSCVENHSSTLREAMYLGLPSISAVVGSTAELIQHRQTGMLYRYGESEVLASQIERVLNSPSLARSLGSGAFDSIRVQHPTDRIGSDLVQVYEDVMQAERLRIPR